MVGQEESAQGEEEQKAVVEEPEKEKLFLQQIFNKRTRAYPPYGPVNVFVLGNACGLFLTFFCLRKPIGNWDSTAVNCT